jgi:uncharacterized protein YodC (DUF2158 family)
MNLLAPPQEMEEIIMADILDIQEQNTTFMIGDVVKINSGGLPMTVIELRDDNTVLCRWLGDDRRYKQDTFPTATIKRCHEEDISACSNAPDWFMQRVLDFIRDSNADELEKVAHVVELVRIVEGTKISLKRAEER